MPQKIMVVDDDKDILDVVSIMLNMHGYDAVLIDNGNGLLEKVKEVKPAIILMDIQLGPMDGRTICKEVKQIEEYAHTAIILFSANKRYKTDIHEYLCDDFIEKPFEIKSMMEKIKHYMDRSEERRA